MLSEKRYIRVLIRTIFLAWCVFVFISFYASMLSFFGGRLTLILDKIKGLL